MKVKREETIDLTEADLKKQLAKDFNTTPENIFLRTDEVATGYGGCEHYEDVVSVKIVRVLP